MLRHAGRAGPGRLRRRRSMREPVAGRAACLPGSPPGALDRPPRGPLERRESTYRLVEISVSEVPARDGRPHRTARTAAGSGMSTAERPARNGPGGAAAGGGLAAGAGPGLARALDLLRDLLAKYGALIAFGITVLVFSLLKPDTFATWDNWKDIFYGAAIAGVVAVGVTIPLVMNDFDLSFGATIGLGGSVAVILVAEHSVAWPLAVLVALLIGVAVGLVNGTLVAYAGGPSFIITLAMLSVIGGIEVSQTHAVTIYQGIPASFVELGQGEILGIRYPILIAIGVGLLDRKSV